MRTIVVAMLLLGILGCAKAPELRDASGNPVMTRPG